MTESKPAVGHFQSNADSQAPKARPQWDKSEWDAKAKQKDAHYAEQAKARDEALQQGMSPLILNPSSSWIMRLRMVIKLTGQGGSSSLQLWTTCQKRPSRLSSVRMI
jgi:hypothetical protein